MRRTVRALSVAALASAALGIAASAASADPGAEALPSSVSVPCDGAGGPPAAAGEATPDDLGDGSDASPDDVGELIDPAPEDLGEGSEASPDDLGGLIDPTPDNLGEDPGVTPDDLAEDSVVTPDDLGEGTLGTESDGAPYGDSCSGTEQGTPSWVVPSGGGKECTTSYGGSSGESCAPAAVQHGVKAGDGGSFTGSVPALVAGGILIAAALGGAVHRVCRRNPAPHG
ncbi:hypothetical protein GR925_32090 [Streptomyces sp. HUCO-GS316]|uniref:hypothetical protein n=1 Tax=Streptomyces sp. HUCO-GS316 TaxID=2692198 RepID=UPI00136C24E3|nr:hypothetical protein [Streptomyces sp. HUCO-GS316]MXM67953.1 hypothetical protein [Streptomyces sp. HUCO-GS316]